SSGISGSNQNHSGTRNRGEAKAPTQICKMPTANDVVMPWLLAALRWDHYIIQIGCVL
ncbi:hypothetical protein U1Q18_049193, partial [Sarracenia purpurea var. burkii]